MVSTSDIEKWKTEWGAIYRVMMGPYVFIYRRLTIQEHRTIYSASLIDCEFEDNVIGEALLYSDADIQELPAVVPTALAAHILESSLLGTRITEENPTGDISPQWQIHIDMKKRTVTPRRDESTRELVVEDPIAPMIVQVMQAFPAYRMRELMDLPMEDLLDLVAYSELALGTIKPDITPPTTMPRGLNGADRQEYLESMSMEASTKDLKDEMRRGRNASTQPE